MVGEALTVFQGTKPEPFRVRVISILRNFVPKQDVVLIRAEDPRVEHSGIVAGMSGSPVYVDGKLMGAIAYTWSFSKEPYGGVTPIEAMLAERARPRRKADKPDLAVTADAAGAADERAGATPSLASALGLPALPLGAGTPGSEPRLQRAAVPLSVSGFGARAVAELDAELRPFGIVPVQAGGGRRPGPPAKGPGVVEPGSAIAVELVRGDMTAVGTGTVTYVDGNGVLAFGHPMLGIGEVYLPLVDAEIHSILPSLAQSFKMSSPLREVGVLVQDRQSCIIGDLGQRTTMLPIEVRVQGPGTEPRTFRTEVARNRRLTPALASLVVSNAISDAEPDVTDVVIGMTSRLDVRGYGALELRDQVFSADGLSARALAQSRGLRALGEVLGNPFEPATIDRLDVAVRVEFKRDVAEIVGVSLADGEVRAGQTVPLRVTLRPYAGPEYVETVMTHFPHELGGQVVKVEAASGAGVKPDVAPPETLRGFLDNLQKSYGAASIVVSVQRPEEGATLRGRLIAGLPSSALDTLRPASATKRAEAYRVFERTVAPSRRIVTGKQELQVVVRQDALGRGETLRPRARPPGERE